MINKDRYLITSALPYANGPLHIGHLAGAYLNADIFVRFQRMMGKDVLFVCGSDEHGAAITLRAAKEGISPREIIDKYHAQFQKAFNDMKISFDVFDRTSNSTHHQTSQDFFRILYRKGVLTEKESEQYYDEEAQQFLADRYIKGECPKCSYDSAYGDQCENCGSSLSPKELINPVSTLTESEPVLRKTTHWYLPLNKDEDWLKEFIEDGTLDGEMHHYPEDWKAHVIGQCMSWIDNGLKPRAMTRDLDWGVDVPQEIPGSTGKKLYVWLDAPIGYISATKTWAEENDKDWRDYWQDEDTALINFIGKDNIVFHCIIFPSILKAHGNYNLPVNVPANQFMNLEGNKISTSRNWAVWVNEYLEDFDGNADDLRYTLTRIMPETKDSEFTWQAFVDFHNNELVNNLANFINRVIVLTNKYYDGIVPDFDPNEMINASDEPDSTSFHDSELLHLFDMMQEVAGHIRKYEFRAALNAVMKMSATGNQFLQFNEPWKLQKTDPEAVKAIMNISLQYVRAISLVIRPFMPDTSDKISALLNMETPSENGELNEAFNALCEGECLVQQGHHINKAKHLFERMPESIIEEQKDKLHSEQNEEEMEPQHNFPEEKPEIAFEDFMKMDMRVGEIVEAEEIEKADKLLKLKVDIGMEERTVVSGIAQHYTPEDIVGQKVCILINLASRKIMGVKSQGMVLMAENEDGNLSFIEPSPEMDTGWAIK